MLEEHGLPVSRAYQAARLSRAAYCGPGIDWAGRDREFITALQAVVVNEAALGLLEVPRKLYLPGRTGFGSRHSLKAESPHAAGFMSDASYLVGLPRREKPRPEIATPRSVSIVGSRTSSVGNRS